MYGIILHTVCQLVSRPWWLLLLVFALTKWNWIVLNTFGAAREFENSLVVAYQSTEERYLQIWISVIYDPINAIVRPKKTNFKQSSKQQATSSTLLQWIYLHIKPQSSKRFISRAVKALFLWRLLGHVMIIVWSKFNSHPHRTRCCFHGWSALR